MGVYNYVVSTGVIIPDTSDIRQEVVEELRSVFGQDFIVDPETPEGQWIDAETTSRQSVARNNANFANQINPDLSGDVFLDAIWALTGGERNSATRSNVQCTITGSAGTLIPSGSRARTNEGDIFRLAADTVLPTSGTLTGVTFRANETGPIQAAPNSLVNVIENVLGWETITNPDAATLGRDTQSDNQARITRQRELALLGQSTAQAVISNVSAVDGVNSLAFRENITDSTQVIDGITLVEHSVWVAVQGGSNEDVALALLNSKTAGANWNGTTQVDVREPTSGQEYTVSFDRPITVNMLIRVTIRDLETIETPIPTIRDIILRYSMGETEAEEGFTVGRDVSPFEISGAVAREAPSVFITLVEVAMKEDNPTFQSINFPIALNQIAAIENSTDITVVIGTGS